MNVVETKSYKPWHSALGIPWFRPITPFIFSDKEGIPPLLPYKNLAESHLTESKSDRLRRQEEEMKNDELWGGKYSN